MKIQVAKGTTSKIMSVFIQDTTSNTGGGLTGLAFNSAGLTGYYYREGQGTGGTAITLATATLGSYTSGGFKEIDATNMPGWYELHLPNAAFATGANSVAVMLKGAANMVPLNLEVQLQNLDPYDSVRAGLTALPNAAAAATGGLACLVAHGGTAQAGAAGSITLAAGASATTDLYKGAEVGIVGGTGAGQARTITAYNGGTKVATVDWNWTTTPDNTSVYEVRTSNVPKLNSSLEAVAASVTGAVGSLGATAKSDVNAEVVDCLNVDTYAELSAIPSATPTIRSALWLVFAACRNKFTQTATTATLRNDGDSGNIGTAPVSDDGTTYTRGKLS